MSCIKSNLSATRGSAINESLVYVSYHNIDLDYAIQLSTLLIRYYRNIWLDRFDIAPSEDWNAGVRQAREQATNVIAIVTDDYLESSYCRAEFDYFQKRGIALTAVIPRDFSTEMIAGFSFNDWIDFRRWFDDPNDLIVENLLSQIPQADSVPQTGERLDYLRRFIHEIELLLAKMPTSWVSLRNAETAGANALRPRMYQPGLLRDWDFTSKKSGSSLPLDDLQRWSQDEAQFILRGKTGSGKTFFARLMTLVQAHTAMRDEAAALPIWIDLAEWDESHQSVDSFIESQWPLLSFWQHWLESNRAFFVLDNWSQFVASHPTFAGAIGNWIDSSPGHRFAILSASERSAEPNLPTVEVQPLSASLAQKYSSAYLTLDQQNSFRQLLRQKTATIGNSQLDYLSIGFELLAADRSLAFNQWQANPMPALISLRLQQTPFADKNVSAAQLLTALSGLAWSMMLADNHRMAAHADAIDARALECAQSIGLLRKHGNQLRFEAAIYQSYLAAESLKKDGLTKYLTRPEFAASHGRMPRKWDRLTLILVDSLSEESRLRVIEQIADIDPFLAAMCLARHPEQNDSYLDELIAKLVQLCAQNPTAQSAFRRAIADLPQADGTADLLIGQMNRFSNSVQLWLWYEVRALPLELPVRFIELVSRIDRDASELMADQLADFGIKRSVAYLVKLSQHQDEWIRRNAIWMLGELKFLPTAILLLDYLESAERDDLDEVVLALMKFAYSELLVRVLKWSQENPAYSESVVTAMAERNRLVTSRLLNLAHTRRLTLNPEFYEIIVNTDEADIAIGLAQVARQHVELPQSVETTILARKNASDLRQLTMSAIKHLPNREGFEQLVADIEHVLSDPPESTVAAGSKLEALLYGQSLFDDFSAQSEASPAATKNDIPDDLQQQLWGGDWQQRHRALNRLIDYPPDVALPLLLDLANGKDNRVRLAAYESIATFEDEDAAHKAIIAALADPDYEIVQAVSKLLKSMPTVDCEVLIDLLDSRNSGMVAATIDVLVGKRHRPAIPALRQLTEDDRQVDGGEATVGQRARAALVTLEASDLQADNTAVRPGDTSAPGFSDEDKIIRTLEVLRDDDWGRTQKAAKFLRKFAKHLRDTDNPRILRLLCDSLSDEDWSVRWAVAEALAMLRDHGAIPYLSQRLHDPSWIVQVSVVRALAELDARDMVTEILPLLQNPQKTVREASAESLGELQDPLAIPALGAALKNDQDDFVRYAAINAIQQINGADSRPWLEYALSDGSVHVRWFAMSQLAPEMTANDLPILRQLLGDDGKPSWEDESLHALAIKTLERIDSDECRALLQSYQLAERRARA